MNVSPAPMWSGVSPTGLAWVGFPVARRSFVSCTERADTPGHRASLGKPPVLARCSAVPFVPSIGYGDHPAGLVSSAAALLGRRFLVASDEEKHDVCNRNRTNH